MAGSLVHEGGYARFADHLAVDRQSPVHDDALFAMNDADGVDSCFRIGHPEAGMRERHRLRRDSSKAAVGVHEIELTKVERVLAEADGKRIEGGVLRGEALPDLRNLISH